MCDISARDEFIIENDKEHLIRYGIVFFNNKFIKSRIFLAISTIFYLKASKFIVLLLYNGL